jgi:acetyl esterase/lipase
LPTLAKQLQDRGYAALTFDYRGVGESGGERGRLTPARAVEDLRASLSFLETVDGVDPERLGLLGISAGGSHVAYTAAVDTRVKSTIEWGGSGNYARSKRRTWGDQEYARIERLIVDDRRHRALNGRPSQTLRASEFTRRSPAEAELWNKTAAALGETTALLGSDDELRVPLESFERYLEYRPEAVVHQISPRHILFAHTAVEVAVPPEEAQAMYACAGEPKRLWLIPPEIAPVHYAEWKPDHSGLVEPIADEFLSWFAETL